MAKHLIEPHGGTLVDLMVSEEKVAELKAASVEWASWNLTPRQFCDLELLMNGAFSPLSGFMTQEDYKSVCKNMRLASGTIWPIPITLDVPEEVAQKLKPGDKLALRDMGGYVVAALNVEDIWQPDLKAEAKQVFGTTNDEHPAVGASGPRLYNPEGTVQESALKTFITIPSTLVGGQVLARLEQKLEREREIIA